MIFGLLLSLMLTAILLAEERVTPTPEGVDFYGQAMVNNAPVKEGDVITAYDPQGNLCGKFIVKKLGVFGYLCVYGDDPTTTRDEGAEPGDVITFKINGKTAVVDKPENAVWTKNHDRHQVNLFVVE